MKKIHDFEKYVCPFTILSKGSKEEIDKYISEDECLRKTSFVPKKCDLAYLMEMYHKNSNSLIYGLTAKDGFPVNQVLQGVSYIIAASKKYKIKGKRVLGSYIDLLNENKGSIDKMDLNIGLPDRGTCLNISTKNFACLIGYVNDEFNKSLIKVDGMRLKIEAPKFENCVILNG